MNKKVQLISVFLLYLGLMNTQLSGQTFRKIKGNNQNKKKAIAMAIAYKKNINCC